MEHGKGSTQASMSDSAEHDVARTAPDEGTPRDVGITTRDAQAMRGEDEDAPRESPSCSSFPLGIDPPDDGAPTEVEDFAPRDATPPTVSP